MHRLIKIRIIRDFEHLEERWRCQPDTLFESTRTVVHFQPAADFYETTQGLVVRLELAGVKPDSLSLSLVGQELEIDHMLPIFAADEDNRDRLHAVRLTKR